MRTLGSLEMNQEEELRDSDWSCCGCLNGRNIELNPDWSTPIFITTLFFGIVGAATMGTFIGVGREEALFNYVLLGVSILVVGLSGLAIWRIQKFKPLKTQEGLIEEDRKQIAEEKELVKKQAALIKAQEEGILGIQKENGRLTLSLSELNITKKQLQESQQNLSDVTIKAQSLARALQEMSQQTLRSIQGEVQNFSVANEKITQELAILAKDLNQRDHAQQDLQALLGQIKSQASQLSDYYERVKKEKEAMAEQLKGLKFIEKEMDDNNSEFKVNNLKLKALVDELKGQKHNVF